MSLFGSRFIEASPNRITQVKTRDTDGIRRDPGDRGKSARPLINKPAAGHYAKANFEGGRGLWEFRVEDDKIGDYSLSEHELKFDISPEARSSMLPV